MTNLLVAELRADYEAETDYPFECTARLIAAIPNMLDLLETAVEWRDSGCSGHNDKLMLAVLARFDALDN